MWNTAVLPLSFIFLYVQLCHLSGGYCRIVFVIYTGDRWESTSYWKYLCRRFSACLARFAEWLQTLSSPSTVLLLQWNISVVIKHEVTWHC